MSLCIDSTNVLANQVSTASTIQISEKSPNENTPILTSSTTPTSGSTELNDAQHQQLLQKKTVTKLLVSNHQTSVIGSVTPVLQKISNPPVITVLNSGGPLTVLKTICVTSGVTSAPHFSVVNNQSLTVTNTIGKTPTITLLNTPVTVVKMTPPQAQNVENKPLENANCPLNAQNMSTIIENRAHNVFVKNTCSDSAVSDVQQGQKYLTANNYSQSNVLTSIPTISGKPINSNQRSKLKILGNVMVPSITSSSCNQQSTNQSMTKANSQLQQQQRLIPRQKILGPNGSQQKFINKLQSNSQQQKSISNMKQNVEKSQQQAKVMYPTHKSQIKTLPPVNHFMSKPGLKSQQPKNIPAQVQRTGSGLRTIPPQRPPKLPNKLNYIGKHAVQAQKMKHSQNRFNKPLKQASAPFYNSCGQPPSLGNKQLAFNQALTAEILETLGNKSAGPTTSYQSKSYEIMPNRYSTPYEEQQPDPVSYDDKSKSGLDTLSLICQAVLLDHNYNATLPPDSPTRIPLSNNSLQANGMSGNSMLIYSPGSSSKVKYPPERKRTQSCSNPVSTSSSLTNISSSLPSNSTSMVNLQDDDAASDISDCSDRKHDTEGEETDTAPEAEAVNNDELYDHYGDYVTRCICGFLHDDGYMVECDQCKVWQHVQCVVKNKQVPDEYLCEKCNPSKPVDPHKARMIQQQWLRERQLPQDMKNFKKDIKMKENPKLKEIPTDSDSSDTENPRNNNNTMITKGRTPLSQRKKSDKQLNKQKKELKDSNMQRKNFKKRERKLIRRKSKLLPKKEEEENRETVVMTQIPLLRQWIENFEEAVTNHYSPELRARISNIRVNGSQNIDTSVRFDPTVNKCRVHTLPLTDLKYLVATEDLTPESSIIELRGKYMLSIQHRNHPGGNLNTRQHAQRPGPFLFFYRLNKDNTEVCVDTRTYGNVARFVRRSCKPNAELRHCIEKGVLHLFIVAIAEIEKSAEITIKHESHDLAAIGTTQISCYCGNPAECKVNKTSLKRNGDSLPEICRKKRGRRTTSISMPPEPEPVQTSVKEEVAPSVPLSSPPLPAPRSPSPVKVKIEKMEAEMKEEIKVEEKIEVKEEIVDIKMEVSTEEEEEERPISPVEVKDSLVLCESSETDEKDVKREEKENDCKKSPVSTRRSSQHKGDKEKGDEKSTSKQEKSKNKKLSREERKLEAILRAIEQMEKANQRKQEHKQTKHVQRRESEPSPYTKDEDKTIDLKQKRKRRKGRTRTTSTHSTRRDRLNSGDSYFTSGDENLLSPNDGVHPKKTNETDDNTPGKHDDFLLTFSSNNETNKRDKSPVRENDSNSNSAHSSPETPLSLACSLVQAAVEPLEPGFKFPKTKKGLMNEWLNKTPEALQTTSSSLSLHINNTEVESNTTFNTPSKIVPNESGPKGSAKKRWLRQAISEDKCDSPQESPPISDMVAPPKKRRLPRESISNDNTPPSTPTSLVPPENRLDCEASSSLQETPSFHLQYDDCTDSQKEILESDHILKERAAEMKQEFSHILIQSVTPEINKRPDTLTFGCLMDPRLRSHNFTNSEHLVGTVEKTLSMLGFEERKPEVIMPIKRKLSITEYRQRKKLNNNEMSDKLEEATIAEDCVNEENNSSESFPICSSRPRLNSPSSSSSSSDDETSIITELPAKVPAFNSEPTELERQREMQSLRLKRAFGLSVDVEAKKPAMVGESIFKSELAPPPLIKSFTILDSPAFPTAANTEVAEFNKSTLNSPRLHAILTQTTDRPSLSPIATDPEKESSVEKNVRLTTPPPEEQSEELELVSPSPKNEILELKGTPEPEETMDFQEGPIDEEKADDETVKPHMFYTPDEEEGIEEKEFPESRNVEYVPPFNNPIYPSINYTSVIDEEGRYEGRNPSPPPCHLETDDMDT